MSSWYSPLRALESRGQQAKRPGSLAGLHEARREHWGQFFTPDDLAGFMWRIVEPAMDTAIQRDGGRVAILDNSVGTGRLLQFADPEKHVLAGVDVDGRAVEALSEAAGAAGFRCVFEVAGMEDISVSGFGVALINPPFSVQLSSPHLEPYSCTSFGRFGPHSSAVSHAYALRQAFEAAEIVCAVLPTTFAREVLNDPEYCPHLAAVFEIAGPAFKAQGTQVSTAVVVLSQMREFDAPHVETIHDLSATPPDLGLTCVADPRASYHRLRVRYADYDTPSITLPVTGDNTVRVVHDRRRIHLKFNCGLTQARVMNAILRARVEEESDPKHRYAKGVHYTGQGVLDVEVHLMQPDPMASFEQFIDEIRAAGGEPDVCPGLRGYLRRRIREYARESAKFGHVIWDPNGGATDQDIVKAKARETHVVDSSVWGSPVVMKDQEVTFTRIVTEEGPRFEYTARGKTYRLTLDELNDRFNVRDALQKVEGEWRRIYPQLDAHFPEIAAQVRHRIRALGIDKWLSFGYQIDDLVEFFIKPRGGVAAWMMGLGKARLALALALIGGGKHNLIVVEAGLLDEMGKELDKVGQVLKRNEHGETLSEELRREVVELGIDPSLVKFIEKPEDLDDLRKINIISYERLRLALPGKRRTYAQKLRRRIHTLVADEGGVVRNLDTAQTRALYAVSAKKRFILDGTAIANYPRDILPLLVWVSGDCTAAQPYGFRGSFMEPRLRNSMLYAKRAVDAFKDKFVTFEWVSNEFAEKLQDGTGAKREIPRIQNLDAYRDLLGAHVKRRVRTEPDVAAHIKIPQPMRPGPTYVEWDDAHLAHYLRVADDFAEWFIKSKEGADRKGRNMNLIAVLARIGAVEFALNYPQHDLNGFGSYQPLTSKQRYIVDRMTELAEAGHKGILYVKSPAAAEMFVRLVRERGVDAIPYHGGMNKKARARLLDERYRFGSASWLVGTLGVTQKGLNLPMADRVLMGCRDWTYKTEAQAIDRTARPEQLNQVIVEDVHLPGSLDDYQAQMTAHKKDAFHAGLDWATPQKFEDEFLHLDTILERFCRNLEEIRGIESCKLREYLSGKAA